METLFPVLQVVVTSFIGLVLGHCLSTRTAERIQRNEHRAAAERQAKELQNRDKVKRFEAYAGWFKAYEEYRHTFSTLIQRATTDVGLEDRKDELRHATGKAAIADQKFNIAKNTVLLWEKNEENRREVQRIHQLLAPYHALKEFREEGEDEMEAQQKALRNTVRYLGNQSEAFASLTALIERVAIDE